MLVKSRRECHLGGIGVGGRILLKLIFKKYDITGFIWHRIGAIKDLE
jgi:hypothetical protein